MKSKTLCLILAPILLVAFIIISVPEIKAQETPIWTDNAYSATGEPISTPTLTSGTEYQIVAATIFWYNYSGNLQADAQYYTTDTSDYNWTNYYPAPNGHSFLQINGSDVNWGAFSNAETNHTYSISFIGTGNPITFQVYDWVDQDITNNYCHIEISIYQVSPSPTATPTPSPSPTPTETPTSTPAPTTTPSPTPTISPTSTPIPTATPSPTPIPTTNPTQTNTPTNTPLPTPDPTTINSMGETQQTSPLPTTLSNQPPSLFPLAYLTVLAIWTGDAVAFAIMLTMLISNKRRTKK